MSQTNNQEINNPKVSVLLPNLNNRQFLEERFESVLIQTFTDWELVIVDGYSDDGAWELIQEFAEKDSRIRILQAPREGIYAGLNSCIHLAQGEYIYIATSDDTMSPDCLEKMVGAMDAHPECGICHTCLKVIDEAGKELPGRWGRGLPSQFYGDLISRPHIRIAPLDGILYCALYTVYSSLTQLLIRRSVFDKVGLFRVDWGSEGDFEWGMRAALVCNTLHIPETLATWRIHPKQASNTGSQTSGRMARFCQMIEAALLVLQVSNPELYNKTSLQRLLYPYRREQLMFGLWERCGWVQKILFLSKFVFVRPDVVSEFVFRRLYGGWQSIDKIVYIREELKKLGLEQCVKVID